MRKIITLLVLSMALGLKSRSQTLQLFRDTSVAVYHAGQRLQNPWAGGMNTPVFAEIDLDGDSKMDLIEFDAPSFRLNPFINTGVANKASYYYAPEYRSKFPDGLEGWIKTYDYDADGDMDLFSYNGGGISLFRNDFTSGIGLGFTAIAQQLQTHYGGFQTNIYASRVNAPALSDLDNDGDMDILAFSISGSWVEHHENFSMDSSGVPGLLNHHNIPVCWGYFVLSNSSNVAVLPPVLPTCPLMPADPYRLAYAADEGTGQGTPATAEQHKLRHAGSSLLAFDKDGDGDKDILNGDILSPNLLYLENCGTPDSAWICAQDTAYPSYNVPAILRDVAGPHYFDGNNDGNKDLIVSNFYFTGEDFYNVMYYRNTTNNQSNVFSHQTSRWLVDGMVEVGTGAHPAFFDVDQDGRTDLLVGNDFYFNNNNQVAKIAYYRNTGTGQKAEYTLVTDDFAGISSTGLLGLYPAFADLDGDTDPDMLLGTSDGTLVYYQNIAGAGNPCIFILSQPVYQSIDIGDNASPQLVDVNRDGDTDLLIGERSGVLNYYENNGSAAVPVFSYVTNNFGGVNVTKAGSFAGFSTPLLFDNGNGYELISGSLNGHLYHYGNIDGNLGGSFTLLDSMFQNIYEPQVAVPAMADVDGDTLYDLVVGTLPGGLVLYTQNPLLSVHHPEDAGSFFTVYPNPVESWLNLRMETGSGRKTIEVFDVRGQMVSRLEVYGDAPRLDVRQLNRGMYLCRVSVKGKTFSQRFVKQ